MADGAKALRQPTRQAFCAFPSAGKGGISQPRGKAEAGRNRRARRPPTACRLACARRQRRYAADVRRSAPNTRRRAEIPSHRDVFAPPYACRFGTSNTGRILDRRTVGPPADLAQRCEQGCAFLPNRRETAGGRG